MPRQPTLADTQGETKDDRPPQEQAGTPEHLESDRPYEGAVVEVEPQQSPPSPAPSSTSKKGSSGSSSE